MYLFLGKENVMSPFAAVAVLFLTILFVVLGIVNVAFGRADAEPFETPVHAKTKTAS